MRVLIHWDEEERAFVAIHQLEDGKECRYTFLKTQLSKRFAGLTSIFRDLTLAENAIKETLRINADPVIPPSFDIKTIKQCLLFTAVVSYAKCFTSADGRGTKLEERDALIYADSKMKKFHEEAMDMRHDYIAHGGKTEFERNPITIILHPDIEQKEVLKIETNSYSLVNDDSRIEDYLGLFDAVKKYLVEKIKDTKARLEKEVDTMDIEELYSISKAPNKMKAYPSPVRITKAS